MNNISSQIVAAQRRVVERFSGVGIDFHQLLTDRSHAESLDWAVTHHTYDVYIFLDIDCIPLNAAALPRLVEVACRDVLIGCAQRANHKDNNGHIYVGPFCMAFSRKLWESLGKPSFQETPRGDVGEELTYQCEERGKSVELLWPTHVDEPIWQLSEDVLFGRGTEYDRAFYHQFDSRWGAHADRFLFRCETALLAPPKEVEANVLNSFMTSIERESQAQGAPQVPGIRSRLFRKDPYIDFRSDEHATDLQGWGSTHPFFERILEALRPPVIIEVGTWKGGSAVHMAKLSRQLGFQTEIVCVDTWLGSPELFMDPAYDSSFRTVNGYPRLYYTFMANVVASGLQDVITPLPLSSNCAAIVLSNLNVRADVVYIDGAHDYESVMLDLRSYWPLLTENGIIILDDYGYSDVTKCVCEFAALVGCPLYATYGKALISKAMRRIDLILEHI